MHFIFFSIFEMFLYYEIMKPIYDSANFCKRLTESEHKNADNTPFRLYLRVDSYGHFF